MYPQGQRVSKADIDTGSASGEMKRPEDWLSLENEVDMKMSNASNWASLALLDCDSGAASSSGSGAVVQGGVSQEVWQHRYVLFIVWCEIVTMHKFDN